MNKIHSSLCRFRPRWSLVFMLLAMAASSPSVVLGEEGTTEVKATFFSPSARLWLGTTQVIPVRVESAPTERWETPVTVTPAGGVEVLTPAVILAGQKTGFLRVRALREGKVTLRAGEARLPVEVCKLPAGSAWELPKITTPCCGAAVWGTITFGVELLDAQANGTLPQVKLRLPDGKLVDPVETVPAAGDSHHRYVFSVPANSVKKDGVQSFVPVVGAGGSSERSGEILNLHVYRNLPKGLVQGECEATIDTPRPERQREKKPAVKEGFEASGDKYVANHGPRPSWLAEFDAPKDGYYQLIVRARGDAGAEALPSIGVLIGEENRSKSSARLASTRWHRVPVGRPVYLKKGAHILTTFYENDFSNAKGGDRNLFLDRYEFAQVAAPAEVRNLRIAYERPLDGAIVSGPLWIRGFCKWNKPTRGEAPKVELFLNGKAIASQYTGNFRFWVDPDQLKNGRNTFQVKARLGKGPLAETVVQSVTRPEVELAENVKRHNQRITFLDPRWSGDAKKKISGNDERSPGKSMNLSSNGDLVVSLDEKLAGKFVLSLDAIGESFEGAPEVEVLLRAGDKTTPLGKQEIKGSKAMHGYGVVDLPGGKKQLIVRFLNDHYVEGKGDRNFVLRGIDLLDHRKLPGNVLASGRIVYPAAGEHLSEVDLVVVEAFATCHIDRVELLIDGKPTGVLARPRDGWGRLMIPVALHSLAPGEHTLGVALFPNGEERVELPPVGVVVAAASDGQKKGRYQRAVHLLDRFGFGPEPEHLANLLIMGEAEWLRSMVYQTHESPGVRAAWQRATVDFPISGDGGNVAVRSVLNLLLTDNPVQGRFNLWSENHFSTWLRKATRENKTDEDARFVRLGIAPFPQLLMASATSPAMLLYLDQPKSIAGRLNENYAREIMELHTLGVHGGYDQADVTALAGLLTGWTLAREADPGVAYRRDNFRFSSRMNAEDGFEVYGMDFPPRAATNAYDRVLSAIDMLAAHPSTARFISRKLAEQYVAVPAPDALVNDLTAVFMRSGGDMREMLLATAAHPTFWNAAPVLSTPNDFAIRLGRMLDLADAGSIVRFLNLSGAGHFDRETPDGYSQDGADYADSNGLLQRWILSRKFEHVYAKILTRELSKPKDSDPTEWAESMLRYTTQRLTGRSLSESSRQALDQVLVAAPENTYHRARVLGGAVAQLPEANLR